jgi:hypothetical protein
VTDKNQHEYWEVGRRLSRNAWEVDKNQHWEIAAQ